MVFFQFGDLSFSVFLIVRLHNWLPVGIIVIACRIGRQRPESAPLLYLWKVEMGESWQQSGKRKGEQD